jgi:hypothetical protein
MTRLCGLGLALVGVLLVFVVQAAPAGAPAGRVKQTRSPIATLAMDGSRVAYASGGTVYVWNVLTGATSTMKGKYSKHTSEVAIARTRVEWITRYTIGNSLQTQEHLFSATIGSRGRLLASGRRYLGGDVNAEAWYGRWIAGAVGSGKVLAVGTWWSARDGTCTGQKLNLVSSAGLKQIVVGPGAIISQSADSGRIAVLRSEKAWPMYGQTSALETPVTVGVYSTGGALLKEIAPASAEEIALTGDRLVVLTETNTLEVYNWKTGTLVHTWPIAAAGRSRAGHLAAYGQLAVYSIDPRSAAARKLHAMRLTTGKDVVLATGRGTGYYSRDAAIGPRGLVYAITYREHARPGAPERGKLVFVPLAKVLRAVS